MENVFRLNRPCGDINNSGLTHDVYPPQHESYVGRNIMIRFLDENDAAHIIHERNYPYDNFKPVFKVIRWDMDPSGKAILVNKRNQIVVADVAELYEHKWYKTYSDDDIVFMLSPEEIAHITEEEYNEKYYSKEKIYRVGQDSKLVHSANLILIEFINDRYGMISREHLNPDTIDYEAIAESVIKSHPERKNWPLEVLRSFECYFNEHRHSELDVPMRYIKTGTLIRDDKYHRVVLTFNEETGEREYLVDDEAIFYLCYRYSDETYERLGGEIDLWRN